MKGLHFIKGSSLSALLSPPCRSNIAPIDRGCRYMQPSVPRDQGVPSSGGRTDVAAKPPTMSDHMAFETRHIGGWGSDLRGWLMKWTIWYSFSSFRSKMQDLVSGTFSLYSCRHAYVNPTVQSCLLEVSLRELRTAYTRVNISVAPTVHLHVTRHLVYPTDMEIWCKVQMACICPLHSRWRSSSFNDLMMT